MKLKVQLVVCADDGREEQVQQVAILDKDCQRIEHLGLTLVEAKQLLATLQQHLVAQQAAAFLEAHAQCDDCGATLQRKGEHTRTFRTLFGTVRLTSPRMYQCRCQYRKTTTFRLLTALLTEPTAVGPSGAGKSSLGTLLGWHRPATGAIRVDGNPLDSRSLAQVRRETAWVDPGVQIWNHSFLDNLSYGAPADPSLPVGQIIAQAHLRSVIERLPDGLQTRLGEGGALISGGEGQRVRLGRAMLRPGVQMVILDEPCRGLDREHRRELLACARELWREATLLCITHDVGETQAFDRVLVMEGGRIVEDGTPADLAGQPQSRYSALLEAEMVVRQGLWSHGRRRRLWLNAGRLREDDGREHNDAQSEPTLVARGQAGRGHGGTGPPERSFSPNGATPDATAGPEAGRR